MKRTRVIWALALSFIVAIAGNATALTYPFTEEFTTNTAAWKNNASLDLTHQLNGGPGDSAHVTTNFSFATAGPQVAIFRGQNNFDSSGDAFVGNWLAENVIHLTGYVRHNAPVPLDFFVRIATSANSPAVSFTLSQPVSAGSWTPIDFWIDFANPLHTNEGSPSMAFYNNVLSNVGNVQIGVLTPGALQGTTPLYKFDLDRVSIVPEPASTILAMSVAGFGWILRRPRR